MASDPAFRASSVLVALLSLTPGCLSLTTLTGAQTIGKGMTESFAAVRADNAVGSAEGWRSPLANVEVGIRHGLTGEIDLGASVWPAGFRLQSTLQLSRSVPADCVIAPSIAVSAAEWGSDRQPALTVQGSVPLLFGVNLGGKGSQLVFGPRLDAFSIHRETVSPSDVLALGGSVAYSWQIVDVLRVIPEIDVTCPTAGNGCMAQVAVGLLLAPGKHRPIAAISE